MPQDLKFEVGDYVELNDGSIGIIYHIIHRNTEEMYVIQDLPKFRIYPASSLRPHIKNKFSVGDTVRGDTVRGDTVKGDTVRIDGGVIYEP